MFLLFIAKRTKRRANNVPFFFVYCVSVFALLLECFKHQSSAEFEGIHEDRLFREAHIFAPAVVEFLKYFFLLVREAFLQVLVMSCHSSSIVPFIIVNPQCIRYNLSAYELTELGQQVLLFRTSVFLGLFKCSLNVLLVNTWE